jgi:erythromycin esterase
MPRFPLRALPAALLLLMACGDGGGVTPPPEPVPETDPEALLTDAQLATPTDPLAAVVNEAWLPWINDNHHTVRSLVSRRSEDLQFLKTVIGGRRLVQLGESGHGVKQFSQAKVRLIRFLHQEMGFDVIAFESGLHECWSAGRASGAVPADSTMRRCTFGVWHTDEVVQLFEYLRETQQTARPLHLAGFDVQISSYRGSQGAPQFLYDVVAKVDSGYAARVRDLDARFQVEYPRITAAAGGGTIDPRSLADSMAAIDARFLFTARYDSLTAFLDRHAAALAAAYAGDPAVPLVARQTSWSRGQFTRMSLLQIGTADRFATRDRAMADNIDFLMDRLYPGKKVIVWAHNAHVMHDRASMQELGTSFVFPPSMGAWLSQRRRAELYTVGLFMYRGSAANNLRAAYAIEPPLANSLEALFYRVRKRWVFVDMLGQARSNSTGWMFEPIPAKEWGNIDLRFIPRNQFDGVLFIDTVDPPAYR